MGSTTTIRHPAYARLRRQADTQRRALIRALAIEADWRYHDGPEWAGRYWAAFGAFAAPPANQPGTETGRRMLAERMRWTALASTESDRARDLFRALLAQLHPQVIVEAGRDERALLWPRVVRAYRCGDLARLEQLRHEPRVAGRSVALPRAVVALRREYMRLVAARDAADRRLAALSRTFPFRLRDKLADAGWIRRQQLALRQIVSLTASVTGPAARDIHKQVS